MDCVHHWLIAPPAGPMSTGKCRKCGAEREFSTSDEKLPNSGRVKHSMAISSGIRTILGPRRVEEAYKE